MGLFEKLERGLERAVNGAFAKAFKSTVQPVEIASAMRRAMDDRAAQTSRISGKAASQAVVPNMFTVELSTKDYDDLTAYADDLTDELLASAEEHIDSQRYRTAGPMRIVFAENTELETGVFTVRPASSRRPFDLTPAGLAERAPQQHDYEEFAELSVGMPVVSDEAAPAPSGSGRAWGTDADGGARDADRPSSRSGGLLAAASGAAGAVAAKASDVAARATGGAVGTSASASASSSGGTPAASASAASAARTSAPAPSSDDAWRRPVHAPVEQQHGHQHEQQAARRPSPVRRPWLDIDGDRYPLLGAITVIGRDHTCDIVLDDPGISRRHAELRVTHDGPHPVIALTDLGSTNGVFVNGERIGQQHVTDGDRLTLGRSSMTLRTGR